MNITFFHPTPLPVIGYGGIERILFWHMVELARLGHSVTLIGHPNSNVTHLGINLVPLTLPVNEWFKLIPEKTDIVHLSFNAEIKNFPTIVTVHGNGQIGETFIKNSVFVSKKHAEIHGSNVYIHNALDLNEYPYFPKKNREWNQFLFLAKASWRVKNLNDAVKACRKTNQHLHVVGGRWWGLSRYIHNHGIIGGDKKMDIIRGCDAMIFPVRWHEPFGIAVIEAMSQGLPVIGSPYGSLPELISPQVGFIAKNKNDLELYLSQDNALHFHQDDIRSHVEKNFTINKHALSYLNLYQKVISGESLNQKNPTYQLDQRAENLLEF